VRVLSLTDLAAYGMTYLDLVAAADVVVTKRLWIVTDAIACRTRMVYTERGDFPSTRLVEGMTRWLPAVHVSNADLFAATAAGPRRRAGGAVSRSAPDGRRGGGGACAAGGGDVATASSSSRARRAAFGEELGRIPIWPVCTAQ